MKKLLLSAVAFAALTAAPVAMAQQDQGDNQGHHDNGGAQSGDRDKGDNGQGAQKDQTSGPKAGPGGAMSGPGGGTKPGAKPGDQPDRSHTGAKPDTTPRGNGPGDSGGNNDRNNNNHGGTGAGDNDRNRDNANDNDRNRGNDNDRTVIHNRTVVHKTVNRTEVLKFRANITAAHRFHFGVYVKPAGWYQKRWTYGERLPPAFFVRTYWINDYAMFGLMEPWDGYVWVRDGNDALLIDEDTGEIIRVEYDVFY
jgi:Ni/Co efflux regulator RcnB